MLTISRERQVVSTKVSPPTALLSIDDESAIPPHGALAVSAMAGRPLDLVFGKRMLQ